MKQNFSLYNAKSSRTLLSMLAVLTFFDLLIFLACGLHSSEGFLIFIIIFIIILLLVSVFGMLSVSRVSVEIDEEGIFYRGIIKKCSMKWQDINAVGITGAPPKRTSYFYFQTNDLNIKFANEIFRQEGISNNLIALQYRKEVLEAIKKHWKQPIKNFDQFVDR